MTKKREKKPVITLQTKEEAETVLAAYATADARIVEITAKMDQRITKIREEYSDLLDSLSEKREDAITQLQHFAQSNMQLFDKKKSMPMAHGVIGFRTGTPRLKLIKKFTWGAVLEMLKEKLPAYVRTVEEPAKDKLLADRDNESVNKYFEKCGIEVAQDESFYVEVKKEELV